MAIRLKANIAYQPIVEEVNRKFVPKKETCTNGHTAGPVTVESNGWMGAGCRNSARAGIGAAKRNYMVIRQNARSSAPSEDEQVNRALFSAVVKAVPRLMRDLQQITRIQQMYFQAADDIAKELNGVSAYGYTLRGWVMAVQFAGKKNDPQYNVMQFPASFDA